MFGAEIFRSWFRVIFEYAHRRIFLCVHLLKRSVDAIARASERTRERERERAVSVA